MSLGLPVITGGETIEHNTSNDNQFLMLSQLVNLVVSSEGYDQLCQRVVHEDVSQGMVHGAHLYTANSNLEMELRTSYGKSSSLVVQTLSALDKSFLAESLMTKQMRFISGSNESHLALPLVKSSVPSGAMLLVMDPELYTPPITREVSEFLAKVGAFFVETKPRFAIQARASRSGAYRAQDQLSDRHVLILQLMAEGLTNGRIGKHLSLSESTIRQETIKIYKTLDVSGRSEAINFARKMGLLPKH